MGISAKRHETLTTEEKINEDKQHGLKILGVDFVFVSAKKVLSSRLVRVVKREKEVRENVQIGG